MGNLLLNKAFTEHHNYPYGELISEEDLQCIPAPITFCNNKDAICVEFWKDRTLHTNYYIGVDWINVNQAIYVEPKLNKDSNQTNYLQMLFSALKHPEISNYIGDLFEIKWDEKQIEITQQQDLLTPLLVVQFLLGLKDIVRKGLKKSYYKVEQNLYCRVKGKVLVGDTIRKNQLKSKILNTYCCYDEFGINGLENRLLKKALVFVKRFLPNYKNLNSKEFTTDILSYIMPAFELVSEDLNLNDIKHSKTNVFYKEYAEGIRLAKLILKRFGYNITNTQQATIQTPPFWIDMSKLFELYVLGLLKDRFDLAVEYHYYKSGNELDYLLNSKKDSYKMVVDAKYRPLYSYTFDNEDIRQLSGYARLKSVYRILEKDENETIDCLIIYPDQSNGHRDLKNTDLTKTPINPFVHFYKLPVLLPELK